MLPRLAVPIVEYPHLGVTYETCARVELDAGFASFLAERERYGRDAVLGCGFDGQTLQPGQCHPACWTILSVRLRL